MRWLRFAVLVITAAIVQVSVFEYLLVFNMKFNLLLVLLVFFAVYCRGSDAIITSFAIGFAADLISSAMGPRIISFGLFGTLLANLHRVIAIRSKPYQAVAIFLVGVFTSVCMIFLNFVKGISQPANIYHVVLGTSLYSSILGPFLFGACAWWMRFKTQKLSGY